MIMDVKQMSTKTSKACALAASALLAAGCLAAVPSEAFAIDETRTFTWANGTQQPEIPQTITGADGREYRLTNQSAPTQLGGAQTLSQQFNRTENSRIAPDQLGNIGNIVPNSIHISQDGYDGNIPRTGINYTPVYRNENDHITATQDGYGATQDAARQALPQNINRNGRTLALGNVRFEEARKDSTGAVVLWKAIGEYSVDVPRQVLDHYDVVANYAGTLTRTTNNGDWQISATYSADDVPVEEPKPEEEQTPDDENQNPDENIVEMPPQDMDGNVIDPSNMETDNAVATSEDAPSDADADEQSSLPIIPIAIGAGVVVLGGIVAGILVARRKKNAVVDAPVASEMETASVVAPAVVAPVIIEDPQCQLIELIPVEIVDEDGDVSYDYKQTPKAELEIEPSISSDIPTVIYFPAMEDADGNKVDFEPVEGAQYWIAIDEETVENVPSKEIIVASDDDKEIYRGVLIDADGDLTDQMMLDTEHMSGVVNGTLDEDKVKDLADELEYYDEQAASLLAQASAAAAIVEGDDFEDDDDFDEIDIEELDFEDDDDDFETSDFVSALDDVPTDDDAEEIEDVEFADDDIEAMFSDDESEEDEDPFAAYGISQADADADDEDSDSEDDADFDYGIDLEPDVDDLDYPEDFAESEVDEEPGVLDEAVLEDIDFEDDDLEEDTEAVDVSESDDKDDDSKDDDDLKGFKDLLNNI